MVVPYQKPKKNMHYCNIFNCVKLNLRHCDKRNMMYAHVAHTHTIHML